MWALPVAGFAATAVAYGPARMGFGLFLPQLRDTFNLSSEMAGLISGLGFFGFFLGLFAAYALIDRRGPRFPVTVGLLLATTGLTLVAVASTVPWLCLGVFLAMSSTGFAWTPFNNAVRRLVPHSKQPEALSIVSTGTSLGVAGAGLLAFGLTTSAVSWRWAWALFALMGAGSAFLNAWALKPLAGSGGDLPAQSWRKLWHPQAVPLYALAFGFGITSSIYISFAADTVELAGGAFGLPARTAPAVIFICYGLLGLVGLATGGIKARLGLARLIQMLLMTSAFSFLLIAAGPTVPLAVMTSAGLQGIYVMMTSAVLAFWSTRLFPALPSLSFTANLLLVAAGSVIGPAAAGFVIGAFGADVLFIAGAVISAVTVLAERSHKVRECAVSLRYDEQPEA